MQYCTLEWRASCSCKLKACQHGLSEISNQQPDQQIARSSVRMQMKFAYLWHISTRSRRCAISLPQNVAQLLGGEWVAIKSNEAPYRTHSRYWRSKDDAGSILSKYKIWTQIKQIYPQRTSLLVGSATLLSRVQTPTHTFKIQLSR